MSKVCNDGCGYHDHELTFSELREANIRRLPTFKNDLGEPAHSKPDGSDWTLGEWACAVAGELGEAANLIKKIFRKDMTLDEARPLLAKEFADGGDVPGHPRPMQAGVNLGAATIAKFNEVSCRVGSPVRLHENEDSIDPRKRAPYSTGACTDPDKMNGAGDQNPFLDKLDK